ncbi:MAG TPA: hypothetical protein VJR29_00900 [bacterium]|nr:hypothetical protein [bacterium]
MTPPVRTGGAQRTGSTTTDSDFLDVDQLLRDPAHADPRHFASQWRESQAFRLEHSTLYLALDALRAFFAGSGESVSEGQTTTLREFRTYAEAHPDGIEALALRNLRSALAELHGERERQAQAVLEIVGRPPPAAAPSAPARSPSRSAAELQAITGNIHFADAALRTLPSYYTLGVLPREGLNQLQNADAGVSLGAEFRIGDFNLFADGYFGANIVSDGAPDARYHRLGLRVGFVEYGNALGGRRGESGFYGSFLIGGRSRTGIGIGAGWCDRLQAADGSTAPCDNSTFQILAFNDSELASIGYGPFELGVRSLFNNQAFFVNTAPTGLSSTNRVPLEFSLTWHLTSPQRADGAAVPHPEATWPGVTFTGLRMFNNFWLNNYRRLQESSYEGLRIISLQGDVASRGNYAQTNLGTFFNGVLGGLDESGMARRLQGGLRHGDTAQRVALGSLMGLEMLTLAIGAAAVPGERFDSATGQVHIDLQGQAFQLAWPTVLTRDALAVLGAVGAFGDTEQVIRQGTSAPGFAHFAIAHGLLTLGGLVLILTSGDGSGNGFFNMSILGNQPPNTRVIEVAGSAYDYPNQRSQYIRLETGTMALGYGLTGLLDFVLGHYLQYVPAQNRRLQEELNRRGGSEPATSDARPSVRLGLESDAQTRVMVTAEGRF